MRWHVLVAMTKSADGLQSRLGIMAMIYKCDMDQRFDGQGPEGRIEITLPLLQVSRAKGRSAG